MAAAPADFRPAAVSAQKVKKGSGAPLTLELALNPDILAGLSGPFLKVGFAAESQDLIENAHGKLLAKGLDLIVANDITAPGSGFGADTNRVTMLDVSGSATPFPLLSKEDVADRILDRVVDLLKARKPR
jgi:phosphopantothenoylcysteine decarboxylase/phosphopantothenate--cysteine ligase